MDFNLWLSDSLQFLGKYSALFLGGVRNTLMLSIIAGVLSVFAGGGLCFLRMSRIARCDGSPTSGSSLCAAPRCSCRS